MSYGHSTELIINLNGSQVDVVTWSSATTDWRGSTYYISAGSAGGGLLTWRIRNISGDSLVAYGLTSFSSGDEANNSPVGISYDSASYSDNFTVDNPANNSFGQPFTLDLLIQGTKVADLTWNDTHVRWQNSGASWILQAGSSSEGYTILDSSGSVTGSPKPAKSGTTVQHPSSPIAGQNGELRTDGKVGYIPTQTGDSDTYEIVADGGSTAGNSSGNPLSGASGGQAAGDPHIAPIFGEKYDL